MDEKIIAQIEADENYKTLRRKRNRLSIFLTIIACAVYYGWIALIAFNKAFLATPISDGVTTIAIPMGLVIIVLMVVLTATYVFIANHSYDRFIKKLKEDIAQ